jgi:AraC family transcriptional regulator
MECKTAWDKLVAWAGPKGLLHAATKCIGIGYDNPQVTPSEKIRYDACFTVDNEVEAEGEVGIQTIDGGKFATFTHKGSYDGLEATYAEIMGKWLPQSGQQLGENPSFEMYLNHPEETPPEKLLTKIHIPIK